MKELSEDGAKDLVRLLQEARDEILQLRRSNEVLGAKVEMIDLFAAVLFAKPPEHSHGASVDVAWKLWKAIGQLGGNT